jgi:phospholipid/cholesterol/gamma-HCH transport system ATP-binding protein
MSEIILELKDVTLFSELGPVLKDLSFTVRTGEKILFFGPEHSGLDSLFPLMLGFGTGYTGDILYRGTSLRDLDYIARHRFRRDIGYLHPEFGLINNMSVTENIALPLKYHSRMSGEEIQRYVGGLVDELALGACRNLRPVHLTTSEILRTAYARAIAMNPDILFIERPFEGQSPLNIHSFRNHLFNRLSHSDGTVLLITYSPDDFVSIAGRFILIYEGEIVYDGNREGYLTSDNPYLCQYRTLCETGPMEII